MTPAARPSRRRFLRGSLGLAFIGSSGPLASAAAAQYRREPQVTLRALAFGTRVSVTVVGHPPDDARRAASAALQRIAEIDALTSLHATGSALARLNRDGRTDAADRDLAALFRHALHWGQLSAGAFDVTVQPLWQRHFAASVAGRTLGAAEIEQARSLADPRGVRVRDDGHVIFARAGMQATLNGLAQGYASDEAWAVLKAHGIEHALVDAGEPRAMGLNAERRAWRIGVRHPRPANPSAWLADIVDLHDAALATSGDDGFSFTPDRTLHHILDPRTGVSPPELSSITVLASTACAADALSTTCMVMGVDRSLDLLSRLPGVQALLFRKDGRRIATPGWPGGVS